MRFAMILCVPIGVFIALWLGGALTLRRQRQSKLSSKAVEELACRMRDMGEPDHLTHAGCIVTASAARWTGVLWAIVSIGCAVMLFTVLAVNRSAEGRDLRTSELQVKAALVTSAAPVVEAEVRSAPIDRRASPPSAQSGKDAQEDVAVEPPRRAPAADHQQMRDAPVPSERSAARSHLTGTAAELVVEWPPAPETAVVLAALNARVLAVRQGSVVGQVELHPTPRLVSSAALTVPPGRYRELSPSILGLTGVDSLYVKLPVAIEAEWEAFRSAHPRSNGRARAALVKTGGRWILSPLNDEDGVK